MFVGVAAAAPLLIFGVAPQLVWNGWLAGLQGELTPGAGAPALPSLIAQSICVLALLLLLALPLFARSRRYATAEQQPRLAAVAAPWALGESLRGLAWMATATAAFAQIWLARRHSQGTH